MLLYLNNSLFYVMKINFSQDWQENTFERIRSSKNNIRQGNKDDVI